MIVYLSCTLLLLTNKMKLTQEEAFDYVDDNFTEKYLKNGTIYYIKNESKETN
jgi:hypothetical protein